MKVIPSSPVAHFPRFFNLDGVVQHVNIYFLRISSSKIMVYISFPIALKPSLGLVFIDPESSCCIKIEEKNKFYVWNMTTYVFVYESNCKAIQVLTLRCISAAILSWHPEFYRYILSSDTRLMARIKTFLTQYNVKKANKLTYVGCWPRKCNQNKRLY